MVESLKSEIWCPGIVPVGHPLRGGLVALWPMWEGTGNTAMDVSDNSYRGTIAGPTWVGSNKGIALKWTATNTERVTATVPEITNQDLSVVGWVQLNAAAFRGIVGNIFAPNGWWFSAWSGGELAFWTGGSSAADVCNGNTNITSTALQHVAVVWTHANKTATFYLNGVNDGSGSNANAITGGGTSLIIGEDGRGGAGGYPWYGLIESLSIYNRALSATEIAYLYGNPDALVTPPDHLAAWAATSGGGVGGVGGSPFVGPFTGPLSGPLHRSA